MDSGHHYFQQQQKRCSSATATHFTVGALCRNISTVRSIRSVDSCADASQVQTKNKFLHAVIDKYSTLFIHWRCHTVKLRALCQSPWPTALRSQPQIVYYLIDLITEKKINQR